MVIGNKQRTFYLLKEFTQEPKLYQLFRGLQFSTANVNFTIGALVKLTFNLMGANNPGLENASPLSLAGKLPAFETGEFITLVGNWKLKGPDDAVPVEYIDGVDISLDFNNNMSDLQGLFQTEAIDKSLGMLDITGTINEYVKDGKLYNLAKDGKGGDLYITVYSEKDDAEYTFILKISFDNSTLSGDSQLQTALPFKTFGEDRFMLRKKVPAIPVPVTGVSLDASSFSLAVGGSRQLNAAIEPSNATNQNMTWSSDNDTVATVDQSGNVLAISGGSTTIRVQTEDGGFEAGAEIEAVVPVTGVSLDINTLSLAVSDTDQLVATVAPGDATNQDVSWASDDTDVVTVDQDGNIEAVAAGTATITVTTGDGGFTDTCVISVS
jgi:hypothetical protein